MKKLHGNRTGWLIPYLKQHGWHFAVALLFGVLALGCAGALLFTSGYLISRSALQPENILMVYVPIVLVRTFGFGKAIFQYIERLAGHDAALRVLSRMRVRLYHALEPNALWFRSLYRTGDMLGLLTEDIEKLQNVYLKLVLPMLSSIVVFAACVAALGQLDGWFALMMLSYGGFLLFVLPCLFLWSTLEKNIIFKNARSLAYQELTDAVFGLTDWVLSGQKQQFLLSYTQKLYEASEIENALRRSERKKQWLSQCGIGGAIVLLTLWAGGLANSGEMDRTWVAALALIAFPLLDTMVRASSAVAQLSDYQDSVNRLNRTETITSIGKISRGPHYSRSAVSNQQNDCFLEMKHASYRYSKSGEWALRHINLHVPERGKLAILGRSGSGKSTLLNLIMGAVPPEEGEVSINGAPAFSKGDHTEWFSVLNQDPYLFDTSVANNIKLGKPQASDEEVRLAAARAGIDTLIQSLPEGYRTRMEETGRRFSGGEKQRIALARILLQNHPIVVLDEPMVGLDPQTERELLHTLFEVLHEKTLIWVTHHLSGMEHMDEIIFIDQGQAQMRGTHDQLMVSSARYRMLYELDCVNL